MSIQFSKLGCSARDKINELITMLCGLVQPIKGGLVVYNQFLWSWQCVTCNMFVDMLPLLWVDCVIFLTPLALVKNFLFKLHLYLLLQACLC